MGDRVIEWLVCIAIGAAIVGLPATRLSYETGFLDGMAEAKASRDRVNAWMRGIGVCKWPAAYYNAADCPGRMFWIPDSEEGRRP